MDIFGDDDETPDYNDFLVGDTTPDDSPEAIAFLQEEIETPEDWLTVTLH
jgi:hypothetical protein